MQVQQSPRVSAPTSSLDLYSTALKKSFQSPHNTPESQSVLTLIQPSSRNDARFRIHTKLYSQKEDIQNISDVKIHKSSASQDIIQRQERNDTSAKEQPSKTQTSKGNKKAKQQVNSANSISLTINSARELLTNQIGINNEQISKLMNQSRVKGVSSSSYQLINTLQSTPHGNQQPSQIPSPLKEEGQQLFQIGPNSDIYNKISKKSPSASNLVQASLQTKFGIQDSAESFLASQIGNQAANFQLKSHQYLPLSVSNCSITGGFTSRQRNPAATEGNEYTARVATSPVMGTTSSQSMRNKIINKIATNISESHTSRSELRHHHKGGDSVTQTKGMGTSFYTHQKGQSLIPQDQQELNGKLKMTYRTENVRTKKPYGDLQQTLNFVKQRSYSTSNDRQQHQLQPIPPKEQSQIPQQLSQEELWNECVKRIQNPFCKTDCQEIEEFLKKEMPNLNSDVPSNRMEVINLQKWFESKIKINTPEDLNTFKYVNICLSELMRQITLDCTERGTLFKEVMTKYAELSSNLLQKLKDHFSLEQLNFAKGTIELKKLYENIYTKKDIEVLEIMKERDDINQKFSKENNIIQQLYTREKEMNSQLNHLRSVATFLQTQLKVQSKDNIKLRIKLKKKLDKENNILERIQENLTQKNGVPATSVKKTKHEKGDDQSFDGKQNNDIFFSQKSNSILFCFKRGKSAKAYSIDKASPLLNTTGSQKKQTITNFNANVSDNEANSQEEYADDKLEYSLSQPYIRKHTIVNQPLLHANELNSPKDTRSIILGQGEEKKQRKSVSQLQNTHLQDLSKKVLEMAIQEQKEESEISSISSEESKLILNEEQNDVVNIDQLNAIGFLDPENAVRKECAETQVNDSLLAISQQNCAVQTVLEVVDQKYDEFLCNNLELDYLIDFRIHGINELQSVFQNNAFLGDNANQQSHSKSFGSMQFIGNDTSSKNALKNSVQSYKGKFNRFEKMYEESISKINELQKEIGESTDTFEAREKELLSEIAEIRAQLKSEKELEEKKRREKEEEERQILQQKEEEEKAKLAEQKKLQAIPDKWKNYQISLKKKQSQADIFKGSNAPRLGQRQSIDFEQKYQTDAGQQIVDKLQSKKYQKFKNFMPLSTLMKQINLIYQDRVKLVSENSRFKEISCANFSYIFLTKLFGLKTIVDQKFVIFILSLKKFTQIFRVNVFARFIGVIEQKGLNYSLDEFNKYVEVVDYIQNQCTIGKDLEVSESETKYYVPYLKVISFVNSFADSRMTSEETQDFKKEIDQLKEIDQKFQNVPVVDIDVFVNKMLQKYKMLVNRAKTYVINAFDSSDLDGNGLCNLEEFLILNRNIEATSYNEEILANIFNDNADNFKDGEYTLTFDKFAAVCVDFGLFSEEAQDNFIGIRHKREIDLKFDELKITWPFKQREYEMIINTFKYTEQSIKDKWREIISVLNDKINSKEKQETKPLLIAEKTLGKELTLLQALEAEGQEDEAALNQYLSLDGGTLQDTDKINSNQKKTTNVDISLESPLI